MLRAGDGRGFLFFWDKMQISGMNGSKVFKGRKVLFITKTFRLSQ